MQAIAVVPLTISTVIVTQIMIATLTATILAEDL